MGDANKGKSEGEGDMAEVAEIGVEVPAIANGSCEVSLRKEGALKKRGRALQQLGWFTIWNSAVAFRCGLWIGRCDISKSFEIYVTAKLQRIATGIKETS